MVHLLEASTCFTFDAAIQATIEGMVVPSGPITRARAKRMKEQLNVLVHTIQEAKEGSSLFEGSSELVTLLRAKDQDPPMKHFDLQV